MQLPQNSREVNAFYFPPLMLVVLDKWSTPSREIWP